MDQNDINIKYYHQYYYKNNNMTKYHITVAS